MNLDKPSAAKLNSKLLKIKGYRAPSICINEEDHLFILDFRSDGSGLACLELQTEENGGGGEEEEENI